MLPQLRNAKHLITKFILGLVASAMIFYFGYSGFNKVSSRGAGGKHGVAATVNGEAIPQAKFDRVYENQMKFYEQLSKNNLPPQLLNSLRQNVFEKLIESKIFAQQAKAIGMMVSDKELAHEITQNQSFYKDGMFDKKFYLENKAFYFQQTGEDYEQNLREEILADKFEKLIRDSISLTDEEIRQEYLLNNTQLNLQKISLDKKFFASSTETKPSETAPEPKKKEEIESEILGALQSKTGTKNSSQKNGSLENLKTKYDLKIEETKSHSLREKAAFTEDPKATLAFECILKLTAEKPVCPKGYLIGNQLVFFKLIERKDPDWAKYDQEKTTLQKNLTEYRQTLILHQIAKDLIKQASVHVYSNNQE